MYLFTLVSSPHETIHHKTLPGIRVDTEQGNQQTGKEVKLLEIELATEGTFRCEAITDDTFQVVRLKLDLVVFGKCVYARARLPLSLASLR